MIGSDGFGIRQNQTRHRYATELRGLFKEVEEVKHLTFDHANFAKIRSARNSKTEALKSTRENLRQFW